MLDGSNAFTRTEVVRFAHCDPAGIVFYPRYFELMNNLVEDWFAALGYPFAETHVRHKLGFPAVAIATEFVSPSKIGEMLDKTLAIEAVGNSSLKLRLRFAVDGVERLHTRLTLVATDLNVYRPTRIPDDVRACLVAFCGRGMNQGDIQANGKD